MSESTGPNLHALGLLDNKSSGGGDANSSAQVGVFEHVTESVGNAANKLFSKPLLGINASELGKVSLFQQFESRGIAQGNIPSIINSLNTSGGPIAKAGAMLVSNGVIQDMTVGVGGSPNGNFSLGETGNLGSPITPMGDISPRGMDLTA